MNPFLVRCAVCGWVVLADWDSDVAFPFSETQWANQFRALLHTPDGLLLTGVGIYEGLNSAGFCAPFDKDMHWSDAGFESSDDNSFAVLPDPDFRGRHGIVFHDACWRLLEAALRPASVSLQRLFDVCSSLPVPRNCRAPTWGHDLGGAVVIDKNVHFPWEGRYDVPEAITPDPVFSKNPSQVPGVDHLLAEDPQQPPVATQSTRSPRAVVLDCFTSLPGELDFGPFLTVSNSGLQDSRPRLPAADRSWLFETRYVQSPRDWRWLYRRTNDVYLTPGLRNRRRIWGLIEQMVDILALVWNELPPSFSEIWSLDSALRATDYCVEVNGHLWTPTESGDHRFHNGCRLLRTQSIAIPDALKHLLVYTATFGDGQYIVGMSLVTVAGESILLGYSSCSQKLIELTEIWGFRVAIESRGLQALQCITGPAGSESSWLGFLDDVPRTDRLVLTDRVVGLEVGFDGCKIVRLAIRTRSPPSRHYGELRDSAVWYPTIPPQNLCLNEESFISRDICIVGYKPLFWSHFGGPGGKYLRHLTGSLAVSSLGILRIHFSFDINVPWEHQSFGRLKLEEGYENFTEFSIDRPGGERIETIKMRYVYPSPEATMATTVQEACMVRCKIYTNRGRSCCILKIKHKRPGVDIKFTAATGTAITGLYATEIPEQGDDITAMGVTTDEVGEGDEV